MTDWIHVRISGETALDTFTGNFAVNYYTSRDIANRVAHVIFKELERRRSSEEKPAD